MVLAVLESACGQRARVPFHVVPGTVRGPSRTHHWPSRGKFARTWTTRERGRQNGQRRVPPRSPSPPGRSLFEDRACRCTAAFSLLGERCVRQIPYAEAATPYRG